MQAVPPIPDAVVGLEPVVVWVILAAALASALAVLWRLVLRPILRSIRSAVELINAQLVPNGGESLVDRVEQSVTLSAAAHERAAAAYQAAQRAAQRADEAERRAARAEQAVNRR